MVNGVQLRSLNLLLLTLPIVVMSPLDGNWQHHLVIIRSCNRYKLLEIVFFLLPLKCETKSCLVPVGMRINDCGMYHPQTHKLLIHILLRHRVVADESSLPGLGSFLYNILIDNV